MKPKPQPHMLLDLEDGGIVVPGYEWGLYLLDSVIGPNTI